MTLNPRRALLVGLACLGALLVRCGTTPCDATSCPTGCCDHRGACRPGTSHWYCGGGGETCSTCPQGDRCSAEQVCVASPVAVRDGGGGAGGSGGSGGGGGSGGAGGSGGSGGGGVACRTVAVWPNQRQAAGYEPPSSDYNWGSLYVGDPASPPDGGYDELYLEEYYFGGLNVPHGVTFTSTDTYLACETCLSLLSGCDVAGRCSTYYFAQAGGGSITTATRNARAGTLAARLTGLTLVEWDYGGDVPVAGGGCVTIGEAEWNSSWDAGAGDGGSDAGP